MSDIDWHQVANDLTNCLAQRNADLTAARAELKELPLQAPPDFVYYVERNMPPGTIISDPHWWADKLWRSARRAFLARVGKERQP